MVLAFLLQILSFIYAKDKSRFFIKSNKPEEIISGLLAGKHKDKPEILREIIEKISEFVRVKEKYKYVVFQNIFQNIFFESIIIVTGP